MRGYSVSPVPIIADSNRLGVKCNSMGTLAVRATRLSGEKREKYRRIIAHYPDGASSRSLECDLWSCTNA